MRKIKMLSVGLMAVATIMIPSMAAEAAPQSVWTNNAARNAIIRLESGGNPYAVNPSSGARGLYQCLPAAHACPSVGDVAGQHKWGQRYATSRYGTWENALAFWLKNNWW